MSRYYARINKTTCGPFTAEELKANSAISPETLVIEEGKTKAQDWVRLRQVPELKAVLSRGSSPPHRPSDQLPPIPTKPKPPPLPKVPQGSSAALPVTRTLGQYIGRTVFLGVLVVGGVATILAVQYRVSTSQPSQDGDSSPESGPASPASPSATRSRPQPSSARNEREVQDRQRQVSAAAAKNLDRERAEIAVVQQYQRYVRAVKRSTDAVIRSETRDQNEPWNSPAKEERRKNCVATASEWAEEERNFRALMESFIQQYGPSAWNDLVGRENLYPPSGRAASYCG